MSNATKLTAGFLGLFVALLAAYSNHFHNGFHFDDAHAVVENPAIRSLSNLPRFFTDVSTFSHDPKARSYRPLVTASLAVDYALGKGLDPFWFHISTFLWFLVLLVAMFSLYQSVLHRAWVALFAVAVFGLHPSSAETINYIVQRGDLYVALGIVAGVAAYASKPAWRRYGLYLIPPLAAMFAKPTGVIFAPILLAYILVIDRGRARHSIPAFVLSAAFLAFEKLMTPPTFFRSTISSFDYWITQPYVSLRYFRSFFLPLWLNVDSDLRPFNSLWSGPVLAGFVFCGLCVAGAIVAARRAEWRTVSFGLWWFLIALIPTAVYPLNEVENDHRMFLPFVGLSLAVVGALTTSFGRGSVAIGARPGIYASIGTLVLAACAWGTYSRSEVWHTDETLWRDDVVKSPNNARGHDHLGAALSKIPGRLPEAIAEYQAALRIKPDFENAHLNLGKALAQIPDRLQDAAEEMESAVRLAPDSADAHLNLGAALGRIPGRHADSIRELNEALRIEPGMAEAHYNLGVVTAEPTEAVAHYRRAIQIKPDYADAHRNLGIALAQIPGGLPEAIQEFETVLRMQPESAEAHMNLGVALSKIPNRLQDAVTQYREALRIQPEYPEARMNLARVLSTTGSAKTHFDQGVALSKIPGHLTEAVAQFKEAVRIQPDYAEAHTTLGIALIQMPGRLAESISEFESAARLQPDSAEAHSNLGLALARDPKRLPEAIAEFEASFRIKADPKVGQTLANLRSSASR